jgi:hypothetical protein
MGAKWNDFRNDVRETIKNTVVLRFSRMITQVSPLPLPLTSIYLIIYF